MPSDTLTIIRTIAPQAKPALAQEIARFVDKYASSYGVNNANRRAAFLSRAAHETDNFRTLTEYASGKAYEGRKDLGNTQPGDGVKFKGRGIFQTTGRSNYARVSQVIFGDNRLLTTPELLAQPEYAVISALIFWKDHNLNAYADKGDIEGMVKIINGGKNGLQETINDYYTALRRIANDSPIATILGVAVGGAALYQLLK